MGAPHEYYGRAGADFGVHGLKHGVARVGSRFISKVIMKGAPGGSFDGTAHGEQAPLYDFLLVGVVARKRRCRIHLETFDADSRNDIRKISL